MVFVLNSFLCTFRHSDRKGYHRQEANIKQCLDPIQTYSDIADIEIETCVIVCVFFEPQLHVQHDQHDRHAGFSQARALCQ